MSPKQTAEYLIGIDLWRHYQEKEQAVYEKNGVIRDYALPFDAGPRGALDIYMIRCQMLAHHAGREVMVLAGTVGVLKIADVIISNSVI